MWNYININPFVLVFLLCILQYHHCLPGDLNSNTELEGQQWHALPQDSRSLRSPKDISHLTYFRDKRYINLGSANVDKQKLYQVCVAPGNQNGHCKHLSGCMLENFNKNLTRFMDYMCIIEQTYIGICCPDNIVTHRWEKTFADELASMLPVVASMDDDKQESKETAKEQNRIVSSADDKVSDNDGVQQKNTSTRINVETRGTGKPRGCGTTAKMKTRIVGGQPADPKEWPWMAALLRQGAVQYCGAVLITDRHVLTAAHCVYRIKPRDITVRLGEYDFSRPEETRTLDFKVTEIRIHRDFVYTTYENDIAIIKIHRPTMFNSYIWPVCLPPVQQTFENKSAIVTGWGTQYYGGPASTVLMEVGVPVWPQDRCVRSFTQPIPNTTICAGAYEGGRDSCQGDSGGPLLHQLANGRWVNIGIVSWGIRCGEPGLPGIYTRVSSYLDWIFANAVF